MVNLLPTATNVNLGKDVTIDLIDNGNNFAADNVNIGGAPWSCED